MSVVCAASQWCISVHLSNMPSHLSYSPHVQIGDYVDIKANSAVQKGMPHKVSFT